MKQFSSFSNNAKSIAGLAIFLVCLNLSAIAAKGEGDGKEKKGYVLKFNGFELKKMYANPFSLQPGSVYRGTINNVEKSSLHNRSQSVITYQRGNTTFIYPYTHKVNTPKFSTPSRDKFKF